MPGQSENLYPSPLARAHSMRVTCANTNRKQQLHSQPLETISKKLHADRIPLFNVHPASRPFVHVIPANGFLKGGFPCKQIIKHLEPKGADRMKAPMPSNRWISFLLSEFVESRGHLSQNASQKDAVLGWFQTIFASSKGWDT